MSVDELEQAIRERLVRLEVKVGYRSLVGETGVALAGLKDVHSGSIEVAGVFTSEAQGLVWVDNGAGAALGIALVEDRQGLKLNVNDEFEVSLDGGITPETLVRLRCRNSISLPRAWSA